MKEVEKVYQIIHDENYNNEVVFDIEISKIKDTELVIGMLVDLYSKEGYKANKKNIILTMKNYDIEQFNLQECNAYFISKMKEYRSSQVKPPSVDKLTQFITILSSAKATAVDGVNLSSNKDYVEFIKELSTDEFEYFKNILIDQEQYEEVTNMINIRS